MIKLTIRYIVTKSYFIKKVQIWENITKTNIYTYKKIKNSQKIPKQYYQYINGLNLLRACRIAGSLIPHLSVTGYMPRLLTTKL